jgi:hypothetical protein
MAILIDETKRVLVQGITDREGQACAPKIDTFAKCDYCDHI